MDVDVPQMRAGANGSYEAATRAQTGADTFARVSTSGDMFGDFAEANQFQAALGQAHTRHLECINHHVTSLGALGDSAHMAATAFADMDSEHSKRLRNVSWNSDS
ncbi:MAG: DUF2563 family protein [Mycobacterium sp.]